MDLQDQLKTFSQITNHFLKKKQEVHELYVQKNLWFVRKRKGKATTIIEGYEGSDEDFKILAKEIKTKLSVGGTFKTILLSFKVTVK
jgi:translation initiation factor 1